MPNKVLQRTSRGATLLVSPLNTQPLGSRKGASLTVRKEIAQFIADIANDEWVDRLEPGCSRERLQELGEDWERKRREFLDNVRDPAELHMFVDLWNWDGGQDEMHLVIQHPVCERSTALMVFWRASPTEYDGLSGPDQLDDDGRDRFELVQDIQARYLRGAFVAGRLSYDPAEDGFARGVRPQPQLSAEWRIAPEMFEPVVPA
jgi:hypothetical protein